MRIYFRAHGWEYLEESLVASAGRAKFLTPALELVADDMMESTATEFESQGRRFGGSWADISEEWRERKVEKGHDPRILYMTHRLIDSLTDRDHPEMLLSVTNRGIRYGSKVPYADAHQHGTGRLPARPFISFAGGDFDRWAGIIASYVVDPMKRAGKASRG